MLMNSDWLEIIMGYRTIEADGIRLNLYLPTVKIVHESLFELRKSKTLVTGRLLTEDDLEDKRETLLGKEDLGLLDAYEERREGLERDLHIQRSDMRKDQIRVAMDRLEISKSTVDKKWGKLLSMTREGYLSVIQQHYCFYRSVEIFDTQKPLWSSYDEFLDDSRGFFIRKLYEEYGKFSTEFDDTRLRAIAKDNFYRMIPIVQAGANIPTIQGMPEMNFVLIRLLYWFQVYTNTLQSSQDDCPPEVLEDDEKFDEWSELQRKRITKDTDNNRSNTTVQKHGGKQKQTIYFGN